MTPVSRRAALAGIAGAASAALLTACTPTGTTAPTSRTPTPRPESSTDMPRTPTGSIAVVFFSRTGENYDNGGRTTLTTGNTAVLAGMLVDRLECDVFELEAAEPYSDDYDDTVARNVREQNDDARPGIAGTIPSMDAYDTVLLGSPIWNVRPPMIMNTFIESVDWSGMTLYPFVTFAVSGLGSTERVYREAAPDARLGEGLAIRGEDVAGAVDEAAEWLRANGLA